jgi:hypothetical protein
MHSRIEESLAQSQLPTCQQQVCSLVPRRVRLVRHRKSFIANERGAVAFETLIVISFLMFTLLLPLADLASAGFQFLFGWQALRNFGQYVQYNSPGNVVTSWPSWTIPTQFDPRYPIANFTVVCGTDVCSSSNTSKPRYFSYTTTVTWSPMVLGSMFGCPCSFTMPYSAPLQ